MLRGLLVLAGLGLTLYALIDCIRTEDHRVRALPKLVWVLVILVVSVVGPLAWIIAGKERTPPAPRRPQRGPVAPDDDPEFLRRLEQQRRQRAREERERREEERRRAEGGAATNDDGDDEGEGARR